MEDRCTLTKENRVSVKKHLHLFKHVFYHMPVPTSSMLFELAIHGRVIEHEKTIRNKVSWHIKSFNIPSIQKLVRHFLYFTFADKPLER